MTLECPQEVISDLEKLLEIDEEYDVIIYTGEDENVKKFNAHSLILRSRSQYFRTAFSKEWLERKDGKYIFQLPKVRPQFFVIILRFIYCGKIDLTKLRRPDMLDLLIAVNELKLPTLIKFIQEYLINYHGEFLKYNQIGILEYVYQRESLADIQNYCLNNICEEPNLLFNSKKFISLKAPLLELILKKDDLSSYEVIIWDNLIKWCLAQHPNISQDFTQWNKKEIANMKNIISSFIPLIRFYEISPNDFVTRIYPFKEILPNDLINNVLIFHMENAKLNVNINIKPPKRSIYPTCVYDSVIVKPKHFAIFASWFEERNELYNVRNLPYNFNLLYRASRDGSTTTAFHEKCDNKGATIIIAKIKNSDQIIGGYNPLFWDSSGTYKSTYDSFIFSFANRMNFQSARVSYSNNDLYSIYCDPFCGPAFGTDLVRQNNGTWGCKQCSYPKIDISPSFYTEDYEVFQIIKR